MPHIPNMAGLRFGMLNVQHLVKTELSGSHWLCRCDCGTACVVSGKNLRKGQHSCGCVSLGRRAHGQTLTATYRCWVEMRRRCANPDRVAFKNYGGRGISVCDHWQVFENFVSDMGEVPAGHTIERTDNDKGYSPANCVWLPKELQSRNRRSARKVTFRGEQMCMSEAARKAGLNVTTVHYRIKAGWPSDRIFEALN